MSNDFQPNEIRGSYDASGMRFGLVVSRFNSFITERLLAGAIEALEKGGASAARTDVVRVPGSFEIPLAAKKMALARRYDAIVAIGCVLRGETAHFDYVATEVARGIQLAQMDTGVPIIFCVLTCDTLEQAIDRAGLKSGNKGYESGLAALEMAPVIKPASGGRAHRCRAHQEAPLRCHSGKRPGSTPCRCCFSGRSESRSRSALRTVSGASLARRKALARLRTSCSRELRKMRRSWMRWLPRTLDNWRLERIALIDRAILRLGAHELRYAQDARQGGGERSRGAGEDFFVRRCRGLRERRS